MAQSLSNLLMGTEDKFKTLDRFGPKRQQSFDQLLQQAMSRFQGNKADFGPIEEREKQRYQQETLPSIMERFSGMGAQRSSGFQEALSRGGSQLGTDLAAMRSQHELGREGQLMQLLQMGLTPQQETMFMPGQQGMFGGMAAGVGEGLGKGISSYMGGGTGGGGDIIQLLMSLFGGGKKTGTDSGSVTA